MCNFFSYEQDKVGNIYYYNLEMRKGIKDFDVENPDSHAQIAKYFKLNEDTLNKFENSQIDQLNNKANPQNGIKWFEEFKKGKEFKELCEIAVKQNWDALGYVPLELITKELCEIAVRQNGRALCYVPSELRTKELCEMAVKQNGNALGQVPSELITKELCEQAVKQNGRALRWVPSELITKELCEIAVKQNGGALYYVPKKFYDELKEKYKL
ncbi:MAG: DUF4116 domain-containing protein [Candidatus Nanoarchaeia archaeon]|nr:DUF4116 domain-containing protein [Candidatus Nanoarchaeia archaeon]